MSQSQNSKNLPTHLIHKQTKIPLFDVFIAGSGPIGATYARILVQSGYNVCMVDIGDIQDSTHPGANQKNEVRYRKDLDAFVSVIQGALSTVSIPTSTTNMPTLDASAYGGLDQGAEASVSSYNGRNPNQNLQKNLPAEAVTRVVGGMGTHWGCATPTFLKGLERPKIFANDEGKDDKEWMLLYNAAQKLIGTSNHEFDNSVRQKLVLETLNKVKEYKDRGLGPLPLACDRLGGKDGQYVRWHSAENVFGPNLFPDAKNRPNGYGAFPLVYNTRCTRLYYTGNTRSVDVGFAEVQDLTAVINQDKVVNFAIYAKVFVIAAGAIGTPQILANSGFGGMRKDTGNVLLPSLGKYITEQPVAFCQIVLSEDLVDSAAKYDDRAKAHQENHPQDAIPIPFLDPEPQVMIPVHTSDKAEENCPWHAQIQRDAYNYGQAGHIEIDPRLIVDLRFFGMQTPIVTNRIVFENDYTDGWGLPQPTFEYTPDKDSAQQAHRMMHDMTNVASYLGGYLPGSNPQFLPPGTALHLGGSTRLGQSTEKNASVADYNSCVWNTRNLYVAGNAVIPTPFATNPTLTSMALAIRSALQIKKRLDELVGDTDRLGEADREILPTKDKDLKWLVDASSKEYPNHQALRPLRNVVLNSAVQK